MVRRGACLFPDGKLLGTTVIHGGARLWEVSTGKELRRVRREASSLAFSTDGKMLATAAHNGATELWEVASGKKSASLPTRPGRPVSAFAFTADGRVLAGGGQKDLYLWDLTTRKELHRIEGVPVGWLAFAPDGKTLASSAASAVRLWDVAAGKEIGAAGPRQ